MNLICQRESELPPLCVQMGCTLPPFNPLSFPSNLFSLSPFSLSMNTLSTSEFSRMTRNNKVWEKIKKNFRSFLFLLFLSWAGWSSRTNPFMVVWAAHNISRKQNNQQTKHNPLLKLDLEQLRSSQIGKKGNADIWTTVCKVKDPKIPSLLFVSISKGSGKKGNLSKKNYFATCEIDK